MRGRPPRDYPLRMVGSQAATESPARPRASGEGMPIDPGLTSVSVGRLSGSRLWALLLFCAAVVCLVPLRQRHGAAFSSPWVPIVPGVLAWLGSAIAVRRDPEAAFRRRMPVLLGLAALLALAPIHTDTGTAHFITLGLCFLGAVVLPVLPLWRHDRGVIAWRILPSWLRWRDLVYVAVSVPLAMGVLHLYFFRINPWLPTHWVLPPRPDAGEIRRLIVGINLVGIWDELFFINVVYGILRSLFPRRLANAAQAVVYTSVLYTMAFTGIGPLVVYLFALTQGSMYEGSRSLLWVLIVHLIVDLFLVGAILHYYYPGMQAPGF
jgi:membrane protease YdiL (CAAX protease family)